MALVQLATQGAAEQWLSAKPQITLWRSLYKRHSVWAAEEVAETLNGDPNFGGRATSILSKTGDCISSMYMKITLPDLVSSNGTLLFATTTETGATPEYISWCNGVALALIDTIQLVIGGTKVDEWTGIEMMAWYRLTTKTEKRAGLHKMMGYYDDYDPSNPLKRPPLTKTEYYVPLTFFNCLAAGQAIPNVALTHHDIRIDVTFKPLMHVIKSNIIVRGLNDVGTAAAPVMRADLYSRRIYLGREERQRIVSMPMEYLVQHIQSISYPVSGDTLTRKLSLSSLQHPTKALLVFYADNERSRAGDTVKGNSYFDWSLIKPDNTSATTDPLSTLKVSLNGTDLSTAMPGAWWRLPSTYEHWPCVPTDTFLYTLNWALNPADTVQPSGSISMGKADGAHLHVELGINSSSLGRVHIVAVAWQVLRIANGLAALALAS